MTMLDVGETTCCYARSDKYWLKDPQGIAWEQFHSLGNIPVFSEPAQPSSSAGACCTAKPTQKLTSIPVKITSCC